MNYQEEYRKLNEDQEKLDAIRRRDAKERKKTILIAVSSIPVILAFAYGVAGINYTYDFPYVLKLVIGAWLATLVSVGTSLPVVFHVDDILGWFEDLKKDMSEKSRLKATESDRKAKMAFFERLINDPDFRAAWEAQMKEKA